MDRGAKIAYEVKYVGEFRITRQIIDTAAAAAANGYSYVLLLYNGAYISPATEAQLSAMGVTLRRF